MEIDERKYKINTLEIGHIYIDNPNGEHMSWLDLEYTLNNYYNIINEFKKVFDELEEIGDYQASRIKELQDENDLLEEKYQRIRKENHLLRTKQFCQDSYQEDLFDDMSELKIERNMYCNLFKEFQKYMENVEKLSDLDNKDFEDLIKLSKGNVFDENLGWIHLPLREMGL